MAKKAEAGLLGFGGARAGLTLNLFQAPGFILGVSGVRFGLLAGGLLALKVFFELLPGLAFLLKLGMQFL